MVVVQVLNDLSGFELVEYVGENDVEADIIGLPLLLAPMLKTGLIAGRKIRLFHRRTVATQVRISARCTAISPARTA